jgi:hypothetical protein
MQYSLTQLAAQIEANRKAELAAGVHPDIADGNAFGAYEAAQERAAYEREMEEERALGIGAPATPERLAQIQENHEAAAEARTAEELTVTVDGDTVVAASPDQIREALENGGRARVTVRSGRTGAHVKLIMTARLRQGDRFVPRNQRAGRVGIGEATVLEVRDAAREYPENYVGRLYLDTGEWRSGREADRARVWAAEAVIAYALNGAHYAQTEFFLATQCSHCGHKLEDPISIQRGIGPECYGRATGSRHARYELPR